MENLDKFNKKEEGAAVNKHLQLACRYVSDTWFPVNRDFLDSIRKRIKEGDFDNAPDLLIKTIRQDYSLFFHCVRKLKEMTGAAPLDGAEALTIFDKPSLEILRRIINVDPFVISTHKFYDVSKPQAQRIQEAMIAGTVSETLCEKAEIDPTIGYSCALLRQLGLTLISWNYPHVYTRALASLSSGGDLDTNIAKVLGFSPSLLGIHIAREWNLPPEIRVGMGDNEYIKDHPNLEPSVLAKGESLSKICQIGETLARVNDPDNYPTAASDWDSAQKEIKAYLGEDGMKVIREKLLENCAIYVTAQPNLFEFNLTTESLRRATVASRTKSLISENNYLKSCPPIVRGYIEEAYSLSSPGGISKDAVSTIIQHAIPAAGFNKGCIYLIDPTSMKLVPRVKIGESNLSSFHAVRLNDLGLTTDPLVAAFNCKSPIKEENFVSGNQIVSFIAGALGDKQKAGVLYIEISQKTIESGNKDIMQIFKALRQALVDCMGLS